MKGFCAFAACCAVSLFGFAYLALSIVGLL